MGCSQNRRRALELAYRLEGMLSAFGWQVVSKQAKQSCSVYVTARLGGTVIRTRISDHAQRKTGVRWCTVWTREEVDNRGKTIVRLGLGWDPWESLDRKRRRRVCEN